MPDVFSKKKRSQIMSKIRSKETKLEINFKNLISGFKFRYQQNIFGKPDFASKKLRIAIFVDSCFWHKCPQHFRKPKTNNSYWKLKIDRNVERAKEVNVFLKRNGWKILRLWEHEIKKNPEKSINKIKKLMKIVF